MSDYSDKNKDELQEELDSRDLPVSGNKDELIARLEEDDKDGDSGDEQPDEDGSDDEQPAEASGDGNSGPTSEQVVKEDGWVVQRGSWRKGPGDDNDSED